MVAVYAPMSPCRGFAIHFRAMRIGYARVCTRDQHPEARHDTLTAAGCEQIFIDTSTAVGRKFFQILGAIAEFEQELMSERTRDGLAAAPARTREPLGKVCCAAPDLFTDTAPGHIPAL